MCGEPIVYKTIGLTFYLEKRIFWHQALAPLIQPHFDYACYEWYPNLNKKPKNKIQTTQNNCVWFSLNLNKMAHISHNELQNLNGLPLSEKINQYVLTTTFKFVNDIAPNYLNEVSPWSTDNKRTLRNDYRKLKHPFNAKQLLAKTCFLFWDPQNGKNCLYKIESTEKLNNISTFKLYLAQLTN